MSVTLDADQELSHFSSLGDGFIDQNFVLWGRMEGSSRQPARAAKMSVYDNYEMHFMVTQGILDGRNA